MNAIATTHEPPRALATIAVIAALVALLALALGLAISNVGAVRAPSDAGQPG